MNTLSEIEEYYKAREQQLLKKLHQQGAALAAAEQALKQLTENQKYPEEDKQPDSALHGNSTRRKALSGSVDRNLQPPLLRRSCPQNHRPGGCRTDGCDDFKICNDTYGHYAGDMALETVANAIHSCIRKSDQLIRYGGDEFLLALPPPPHSAMNRMMLTEILGDSYHILEAENGRECMEKLQAEAGNIALVLLDINMPVMDGFEVLKAMNANHTIEDIPVIMISSEDSDATIRRSYELGASDYVNRPFDARIVYRRVTNTIKLYAKQRRLVQMVSEQIRARENNTDTLVGVLSHIVEFRNGESGAHVRHIRIITELLLRRLLEISSRYSITAEQQDMIPLASALHDIGKIGIDEKVLNKPGRLTPEEFEVMKTHSMLGAKMLHDLDNFAEQPLLQTAYEIARWHHERWDGRGYPDGLKGDEIPISAQLVSLADVYDALTSERCYKKAFSHEKAVQMILNGECGAFNPLLLQCLTDIQADLKEELQQHN